MPYNRVITDCTFYVRVELNVRTKFLFWYHVPNIMDKYCNLLPILFLSWVKNRCFVLIPDSAGGGDRRPTGCDSYNTMTRACPTRAGSAASCMTKRWSARVAVVSRANMGEPPLNLTYDIGRLYNNLIRPCLDLAGQYVARRSLSCGRFQTVAAGGFVLNSFKYEDVLFPWNFCDTLSQKCLALINNLPVHQRISHLAL